MERGLVEPVVIVDLVPLQIGLHLRQVDGQPELGQRLLALRLRHIQQLISVFLIIGPGQVLDVLTLVSVLREGHRVLPPDDLEIPGFNGVGELIDLVARVVHVKLPRHVGAARRQHAGQGVSQHAAPGIAHVHGARGVGGDEFHHDLLPLQVVGGAVAGTLALHRLADGSVPAVVETEVQKARSRNLRGGKVAPRQVHVVQQCLGDITGRLPQRLGGRQGKRGGEIAVAQTLAAQMEEFVDRPDKIPQTLSNFKENVSSLGTSINNLSATAMDIDYIVLAGDKSSIEEVNEGSFDRIVHECTLFINSFRSDSSALGNVYDSDDPDVIDVWITAGRDQSNILKNMVDQQFTPTSKETYGKEIKVNVKLIDAAASANTVTNSAGAVNAMLPAVMSGNGPDVALCISQTEPVNYALRGATVDLTQFSDYKDVLSEYQASSYESYWLKDKTGHKGLYGLPETENYNVLFYRTDIMDELGIDATQINTWDDVIKVLPKLQKNSMSFAIPSVERKINNASNPDLANYYAQLVQRGGSLYRDEGIETTIGSTEGIQAFEFYTKLFTNYKLVKQYDFANRFRSGEMPIGVADYSTFNTLSVFAPEIKGLWNFGMLPGVKQEDGSINRSVQSWGTASMMLKGAEQRGKKEIAWDFLKWWASADTQATYARELEAVMGAAARYATANKETFKTLSWSSKESAVLDEQHKWAFGIPQVAGGYYTERHITNAIRKVMNNNEDPRETILDYVITINKELSNKREEFGLKTLEQEEKETKQK